jgi:hypothetical protein
MKNDTFRSNDVVKILGTPQRRVVNAVDKGLVVPKVGASGAGSKREYDYVNLLEFGLVEALFDLGQVLHQVKRIVTELREAGDFREWAEDWDGYFSKQAKRLLDWYNQQKHQSSRPLYALDSGDLNTVKDALRPEKPTGILFYTFMEDGSSKKRIVPWEMKTPFDEANFLIAPFLYEDMVAGKGLIIVNLGKIKEKIDASLEAYEAGE